MCWVDFYGSPFVSKLCIFLMGWFSTKNRLVIFSNKYRVDYLYKFQNIGSIFDKLQNIGSIFGNKISGRFFDSKISTQF